MVGVLARLEDDLDRNALYRLPVVARRFLWRQEAELRAGRGGDAVDVAIQLAPESIDLHRGALPGLHVAQLRLLEVGRRPDVSLGYEREQRLARLNHLSRFNRLAADDAGRGGFDGGTLEIQ